MNRVMTGVFLSLCVVSQFVSASYAAEQYVYMPGSVLAKDTQLQNLASKVFEELESSDTKYSDVAQKLHGLIDWMALKGGRPPKNFKRRCLDLKKELALVPLEKDIQASVLQLIDKASRKRVGLSATAKWGIGLVSAAVVAVVAAYLARRLRGPDVLVETSEGQRISVRDPRVRRLCEELGATPTSDGLFELRYDSSDEPDRRNRVDFAELQRRFAEKQRGAEYHKLKQRGAEYDKFVKELHKKINDARYGKRDLYNTSWREVAAGMAIYDCLKKVVDWPDLQQRKKFLTDLQNYSENQGSDSKRFLEESLKHAFKLVIYSNMSNEDMRKMVTFFTAELGFPTYVAGMAIYDCVKQVLDWQDLQQRKKFLTDLKNCSAFQGSDSKRFLQESLEHAFKLVIYSNMSNEDMRKMVTFFTAELGFPTYSELYAGTKYLMEAIRLHNTHMVTFLIENRVPVNGSPSRDYQSAATPLAKAIYQAVLMNDYRDHTKETRDRAREIVACLLKAGAAVNQIDSYYGQTPLSMAFRNKDYYLIGLLLEYGADPRLKEEGYYYNKSVYEAALDHKDLEFKTWFLELCKQRRRYSPLRKGWMGTVLRAANSRAPQIRPDGFPQCGPVGSVQVAERAAEMQREVAASSGRPLSAAELKRLAASDSTTDD